MESLQNLSFFDFFDVFKETEEESHQIKTDVVADVLSDIDAYLKKGTVLESLARERYKQNEKRLFLSNLEETLYSIKVTAEDTLSDIIRKICGKIIRPLLRAENMESGAMFHELLALIHEDFNVTLRVIQEREIFYTYIGKRISQDETILELTINEAGYQPLRILGTKKAPHSSNRKNVLYKDGVLVADLGEVLSFLVILSQIKREFSRIRQLTGDDRLSDAAYCSYKAIQDELRTSYYRNVLHVGRYSLGETLFTERDVWCLNNPYNGDGVILPCIKSLFTNPPVYHKSKKIMQNLYYSLFLEYKEKNKLDKMPVCMGRSESQQLYGTCFLDILDISYHDFLKMHQTFFWPFISLYDIKRYPAHPSNLMEYCITKLYRVLYEEKTECIKRHAYQKQSHKDYATVFVQKKNIPKKVLAAMASSSFNQYFGYVEMDSDCDLSAVEEAAKEFIALKEQYLPFIDSSKNSIRIRKLGHHKASGLYSSFHRCLCIDISSPSSLIHEYGHLIDYEYNNLSLKQEFMAIRNSYSKFMKKQMSNGISQLSGKGKYNLDYFLTPTEIFARALEIYFTDVLKIRNSLVKREYNFAYPDDTQFVSLVEEYFQKTFLKLSDISKYDKASEAILAADSI